MKQYFTPTRSIAEIASLEKRTSFKNNIVILNPLLTSRPHYRIKKTEGE